MLFQHPDDAEQRSKGTLIRHARRVGTGAILAR
jgi:hypothetical protein